VLALLTVARHLTHRVPSVTSVPWSTCDHSHARVTIGIPTFNRSAQLARAVASCRAQTYRPLAIIISDNASTDETASLCRAWRDDDSRITVIRQEQNIGREPNFRVVLGAASTKFFMWLSDDDWLDTSYVAACMAVFAEAPASSIVGGRARYTRGSGVVEDEEPLRLDHDDPTQRVISYLTGVSLNGEYYGMMKRREMLRCDYPMTLAGDWYFVAQMAALGTIRTTPSVTVHRDLSGASIDMAGLAQSYGLQSHWGYDAHLWSLLLIVPALALGRGTFGTIATPRRLAASLRLSRSLAARWWRNAGRWRTRTHKVGRRPDSRVHGHEPR
jgi:hypothetical protein